MRIWLGFLWIAGGVILLFGVLAGVVTSFSMPLVRAHLLFGLLALFTAVLSGWLGWREKLGLSPLEYLRGARFGTAFVAYSVVFIGILISINWIASRPGNLFRWDLTELKRHSLSEQTFDVLRDLKHPVRIVAFLGVESTSKEHELLKLYDLHSPLLTVEFVNPRAKPHLIEKYRMYTGQILHISSENAGMLTGEARTEGVTEEEITNALVRVTRGVARRIYVVVGYEQPSLSDGGPLGLQLLASSIRNENLIIHELVLAEHQSVPEDAAGVLVFAPRFPLGKHEEDLLISYAETGGKLMLFSDPQQPDGSQSIRKIARELGVEIGKDLVIDQVPRFLGGTGLGAQPVVREYGFHTITKRFTSNNLTAFNLTSSVRPIEPKSKEVIELLKTSPNSWAESGVEGVLSSDDPTAEFDESEGDIRGPVSIAVAVEREISAGENTSGDSEIEDSSEGKYLRAVIFGDVDWILNANLHIYSNRDLFLNSLRWITGEEHGITIRPIVAKSAQVPIAPATMQIILTFSLVVPELILVVGLAVWWRRRSYRSV